MPDTYTDIKWVNFANKGEPQYRIGDAVLMRKHQYGRNALKIVLKNSELFKESILFEYANRIDQDDSDPQLDVLHSIVQKHIKAQKYTLPDKNELVVHLRLGNVKGYDSAPEILVNYIADLFKKKQHNMERVTIVSALHFGQTYFRKTLSVEKAQSMIQLYRNKIECILQSLSALGIKAKLYSNQEIDRDFCFLASSKLLILGSGHFSLCAAMISSAKCYEPPWIKTGSELVFSESLDIEVITPTR